VEQPSKDRWLLLIHQIPPKPNYFRVKIGRRLQRIGAVALKNSVYVLPRSDQAQEDFEWVAREIVEGGGDASICDARFVGSVSDDQIEALFHAARDADYAQIAGEARDLVDGLPVRASITEDKRAEAEGRLPRLKRRLADVVALDFLDAPGREAAERQLRSLEERLAMEYEDPEALPKIEANPKPEQYRGRTWVTRKGIHVDRMASGWLIRRFIDRDARFKFVSMNDYHHDPGELRYDMFEAEFTHEGDRCTFEVMLSRLQLRDPALNPIAEIVHDIDLKDSKFGREDALGFGRLVAWIAMAHKEDEMRLERACAVLDDLYEYFKRKRLAQGGTER
jgi:hypothetical protein